jgi:hypothetical protein
MRKRSLVFFLILVSLTINSVLAEDTAKEFWPEVDLWWKTSKEWRLSSFLALSRNVETNYREGDILIQGEYSWGENKNPTFMRLVDVAEAENVKPMMARIGYLKGRGQEDEDGEKFSENSAYGEFYFRIPIKSKAFFTQRFRSDFRLLGEEEEYSYRLRYRLMLEKELISKNISYVPYFNIEPEYDSRYDSIALLRTSLGSSVKWSKWYALEGNVTYQYGPKSETTNLYAITAILHLFFDSSK